MVIQIVSSHISGILVLLVLSASSQGEKYRQQCVLFDKDELFLIICWFGTNCYVYVKEMHLPLEEEGGEVSS